MTDTEQSGADLKTASGAEAGRRAGIALVIAVALTTLVIMIWGAAAYDWIKAVHVIAVMSWMAGLLYLPRLFIYHCDAPAGSQQAETFKLMEQRLYLIIMTPAMVISWGPGFVARLAGRLVQCRLDARQIGARCRNVRCAWVLRPKHPDIRSRRQHQVAQSLAHGQ